MGSHSFLSNHDYSLLRTSLHADAGVCGSNKQIDQIAVGMVWYGMVRYGTSAVEFTLSILLCLFVGHAGSVTQR